MPIGTVENTTHNHIPVGCWSTFFIANFDLIGGVMKKPTVNTINTKLAPPPDPAMYVPTFPPQVALLPVPLLVDPL